MKKILSFITITAAIAVVMAACNRNPLPQPTVYMDTTGFAQFQTWKAMEQQEAANAVSSPGSVNKTVATNKNVSMTSSSTHNAKVAKKKGWSKAAKYSAVGGGSGVILGALINKRNRVAGGAVGGVLGAGLGYLWGRSKDKKEGRY